MTSKDRPTEATEAYVWIWLPNATEPVVAGLLSADGDNFVFNYGRSYLDRTNSIPLYEPELPLKAGIQDPQPGLRMPSCIRDASPDSWGRRVIVNRYFGTKGDEIDVDQFGELTYLLESGSDRIGALDFQSSATEYVARKPGEANFEELMNAADLIQQGIPLPPALEQALFHGSSIGGARPKALIADVGHAKKLIAKFSAQADVFNVVKGEYVAMRLAERVGLNVAPVQLIKVAGRDILLVERFDRQRVRGGWVRKGMVSALTLLGIDEMMARYASYEDLCTIIRHRFTNPGPTLRELYGRLIFNILVSNTDDHARNHAAFWDGIQLTLTPAYDICPQRRAGNEASQAMLITGNNRMSQLEVCRQAAKNFQLSNRDADSIIESQVETIQKSWPEICEEARLGTVDQNVMWRRQILNPYVFEGLPRHLGTLAS